MPEKRERKCRNKLSDKRVVKNRGVDNMEDEQQQSREANKICGVCGDRALGYNFNAVSCESCKAFFRRNALKNKDFRCPFTENCNITPVTRRFCQKCRLDKCFLIGMKKEYIMTEEDKVVKRHKIEQNRAKKRPPSGNPKVIKTKREIVDEYSMDNDTSVSLASVVSAASTASDGCFWESDRKYMDLDSSRQTGTEGMSPVMAASVPSPSSPPENRDIVGSKTLEMLKDSVQSLVSSLEKNDQPFIQTPDISGKEKLGLSSGGNGLSAATTALTTACDSAINTSCPSTSNHQSDIEAAAIFTENIIDNCGISNSLATVEATTICKKPEVSCQKGEELITKLIQDPGLIMKFFSSPNLVAKVFQDKSLIMKIMTDPSIVTRLAADPQIFEFIEGNGVSKTANQLSGKSSTSNLQALANDRSSDNSITNTVGPVPSHIENPILTDLITAQNVETYESHVEPSNSVKESAKSSDDVTRDVLQEIVRTPISANSIESILCEAIKLEFSAYSTIGGNHNSRELNDAERAKLNELIVANKALLAPLDDDITNLVGDECRFKGNDGQSDPMLLDVINLTAIAIRRLIKMSKKINAFKNMCQEDQLALLKGGCTEMMILRSALNYDPDKDMWKIPHSQERMSKIKVDVLKEAKGNLYTEHARFVRTFDPRWRDENIILILSAIALFSPDRPRVVHSDVIKLEQNSYYYLLRRYLESVYPGCEAKSTFLKLIQKISELHRLNDEVVGVYLNVNPSSVEPLLIEIFDLKH